MGICSKIEKRKATGKSYGGLQMMKEYIMALDQGTTSSRCILFDKQGNICSMAQKEFEQIYLQAGWVEHDPMEIRVSQLSVATETISKIGAAAEEIAGIGRNGRSAGGIVWSMLFFRRRSEKYLWNRLLFAYEHRFYRL